MVLGQLYPDGDFSQEMELDGWARSFQPESTGNPSKDTPSFLHPSLPTPREPGSHSDDSEDSSDTHTANRELIDRLSMLSITPNYQRYFGKSSGITLLRSALSAKSKVSDGYSPGIDPERRVQRRPDFWHMRPVCFWLVIF
jgi:hypothetical protein